MNFYYFEYNWTIQSHNVSVVGFGLNTFFHYRHSLLDAKINSVLSLSQDQAILNAVQSIIQNMIACEDSSQQQLSYLQSKHLSLSLHVFFHILY